MKNNASNMILNNAKSLLESAILLKENNKLSHAGHFAVYSIEECAKCIMRENAISQFYKKSDFINHYRKEDALKFIWVILGKLSVCYTLEFVSNSGYGDQAWKNKVKDLLPFLIKKSADLHSKEAVESMKNIEKDFKDQEESIKFDRIRKFTIYTNPDSGCLENIKDNEIHDCINFARFCLELIQMIHEDKFSWNKFFEVAPQDIADLIQSEAESINQKLNKDVNHD